MEVFLACTIKILRKAYLVMEDDNGLTIQDKISTGELFIEMIETISTQTATGLTAGNYGVTITDAKGCTASATSTIISPPPLIGQFTKGTASCASCGCKEWIMVNASGGTSPYSYSWPDGYINRYKNHLCPGSYIINIKDKNGCSINVNFTAP